MTLRPFQFTVAGALLDEHDAPHTFEHTFSNTATQTALEQLESFVASLPSQFASLSPEPESEP